MQGYRTYLLVGIGVLIYGAEAVGLISQGTAAQVEGLLALLGLGTLRMGIKNDTSK